MSKYGRYRVIDPDRPHYHGFDKIKGQGVTIDELERMGFVFDSVPEPYSLEKPLEEKAMGVDDE